MPSKQKATQQQPGPVALEASAGIWCGHGSERPLLRRAARCGLGAVPFAQGLQCASATVPGGRRPGRSRRPFAHNSTSQGSSCGPEVVPGEHAAEDRRGEAPIGSGRRRRARGRRRRRGPDSSSHAMAANPPGSGEPKGWKPRVSAGAASMPCRERTRGGGQTRQEPVIGRVGGHLHLERRALAFPLQRLTEYQSMARAACATTDATVKSRPGHRVRSSRRRGGPRASRSTSSAASSTSSPVTGATIPMPGSGCSQRHAGVSTHRGVASVESLLSPAVAHLVRSERWCPHVSFLCPFPRRPRRPLQPRRTWRTCGDCARRLPRPAQQRRSRTVARPFLPEQPRTFPPPAATFTVNTTN